MDDDLNLIKKPPVIELEEDIKPSWLKLSENELAKQLTKQKLPPPIISSIISRVRYHKAARKAAKTKATVAYQLWDDVLKPARTELATVRVLKALTKRDMPDGVATATVQAKYDALCAYEDVLIKVIERLRKVQRKEFATPMQFAALLREENKFPMPEGKGSHWTDYVSETARKRVLSVWQAYPESSRGRKKVPFEYKISPDAHDRQRRYLAGQLSIALSQAEQEYEIAKDDASKQRISDHIDDINRASFKLDTKPRTAPLPKTWEGLLK